MVSFNVNSAWLHEVLGLKPNWFLCDVYNFGEQMRMSFSKICARQFDMEMGLILLVSLVLFFWSLMMGFIIEMLSLIGTTLSITNEL